MSRVYVLVLCALAITTAEAKRSYSTYSNYVSAASINTHNNSAQCPGIAKFSQMMDRGSSAFPNCGGNPFIYKNYKNKFNNLVLDSIKTVRPGGGNALNGPSVNFPLTYRGNVVVKNGGTSNCVGGPWIALVEACDKWSPPCDLGPGGGGTSGPLYDVMRNDHVQFGDVQGRLRKDDTRAGDAFGEQWGSQYPDSHGQKHLNPAEALTHGCPGDFLNFSRKIWNSNKKLGHGGIFLGVENDRVYWWSSNSASDGWGIDCAKLSDIQNGDFALTRVKDPKYLSYFVSRGLWRGVRDQDERKGSSGNSGHK